MAAKVARATRFCGSLILVFLLIDDGKVYGFVQLMNPGPSVLYQLPPATNCRIWGS